MEEEKGFRYYVITKDKKYYSHGWSRKEAILNAVREFRIRRKEIIGVRKGSLLI